LKEGIELIEVKATNLHNYTAERNKRKQKKYTILFYKSVLTTKAIRAVVTAKKATEEPKKHAKIAQE
jgi:hypothetical protein